MTRNALLLTFGAALALTSALVVAQDAPESLLPPGFDKPRPAPKQAPAAPVAVSKGSTSPSTGGGSSSVSVPVVQQVQGAAATSAAPGLPPGVRIPTLQELERMSPE